MKLLALLVAALLLVFGASFWVFHSSPRVTPCDERVVAEATGDRDVAAATVRICDGVVTTHVSVRRAGSPPSAQGEVFAAEGDAKVALSFRDGTLFVDSAARRILREETHWRELPVRTRLVR